MLRLAPVRVGTSCQDARQPREAPACLRCISFSSCKTRRVNDGEERPPLPHNFSSIPRLSGVHRQRSPPSLEA